MARNYEDEYNQALEPGDLGTSAPAPAAAPPAADLSTLLAELGGDNLRNRVIAEGLQNQGVSSTKDIEVQKVPVAGHFEGTDEASYYVPETTENVYVNKTTGEQIDPNRVGIIQNGQGGVSGGDIFFNMNADDSGNVSFDPQWSPRSRGFMASPVGQLIMKAGAVIPNPLQPAFVAANVGYNAAHDDWGKAIASALPYGLNQLAGSELLGQLAGNPDFDPRAMTSSGQIAEALGVPSQYADVVGKIGASELSNTLKGGPLGMGALNSVVGEGVKSGLSALGSLANSFLPGVDLGNLSEDELNSLYGSQSLTGPGSVSPDLSLYSPDQLNQLYNIENPGAYDAQALSAVADPDALRYGDIFGNMSRNEIDNLYGSQVPLTNPTNTLNTINVNAKSELPVSGVAPELYSPTRLEQLYNIENPPIGPNPLPPVTVSATRPVVDSGVAPELYSPARLEQLYNIENPPVTTPTTAPATTTTPANTAELPKVEVSAKSEKPDSGVSPVTALTTPTTSTAPTTNTTPAKTTSAPAAITSSQIASMAAGAIAPAIVAAITGDGGSSTPTTKATTTTQAPAAAATETSAPTTVEAQGMQALPNSQNRYWRQTGAQGTGGKGGVRFFDWYDTPENRTMAPTNTPAVTPEQVAAPVAPTAKQYFNAATNRYYTDPTGKWQPPAGWTQTGLKDGGEVKTKHYGGGGYADFDLGLDESLGNDWAQDLSYAPLGDLTGGADAAAAKTAADEADAQNIKNIEAANAGVGSSSSSSILNKLLQAAKDNPNLTKALLAGGLGAALGYAGRPKSIAPMGLQGLGLSQGQVHGALKGVPVKRAEGGEIDGYARGGGLHYLKSAEDGMADRIPATIDNKQPAKLSGGEFVIPADVVSHLGNGNSEAGAKQLYAMMDRIRHARTGTKKQGKQINPAKFTPK